MYDYTRTDVLAANEGRDPAAWKPGNWLYTTGKLALHNRETGSTQLGNRLYTTRLISANTQRESQP
jgi:hypothetical protein